MKKLTGLVGLFVFSSALQAQTWDEWFRQKKTQREYLAKQIVALQFYIGYLEKGYEIANAGLKAINDIKNGDFSLHNSFFNALTWVKPSIRNCAAVYEIIIMQRQIAKRAKLTFSMAGSSGQYTSAEMNRMKQAVDRMLEDCGQTLQELVIIITDGELDMKDDERLRRISELRKDMEGKYAFCRSFSNHMHHIAMQRLAEQKEVNRLKKIHGLN